MGSHEEDSEPLIQPPNIRRSRMIALSLGAILLVTGVVGYTVMRIGWERNLAPMISKLSAELESVSFSSDTDLVALSHLIVGADSRARPTGHDQILKQALSDLVVIYGEIAPMLSPMHQAMLLCRDRPEVCINLMAKIKQDLGYSSVSPPAPEGQ